MSQLNLKKRKGPFPAEMDLTVTMFEPIFEPKMVKLSKGPAIGVGKEQNLFSILRCKCLSRLSTVSEVHRIITSLM